MRIPFLFIVFLLTPLLVLAQDPEPLLCGRELSIEKKILIQESKALLGHVHRLSPEATVEDIQQKDCPSVQAFMLSAMARTYADLIREYELEDNEAQERLYHKIQMNLAYLQFTAGRARGDASSLNRLIRQKLIFYLPEGILEHPGFHVSVEGL